MELVEGTKQTNTLLFSVPLPLSITESVISVHSLTFSLSFLPLKLSWMVIYSRQSRAGGTEGGPPFDLHVLFLISLYSFVYLARNLRSLRKKIMFF